MSRENNKKKKFYLEIEYHFILQSHHHYVLKSDPKKIFCAIFTKKNPILSWKWFFFMISSKKIIATKKEDCFFFRENVFFRSRLYSLKSNLLGSCFSWRQRRLVFGSNYVWKFANFGIVVRFWKKNEDQNGWKFCFPYFGLGSAWI